MPCRRLSGMPTLREYQEKGVAALERASERGRHTLYVLPTGGGKTVVVAELVRRWEAQQLRTLYLVHRREIFDQTLAQLKKVGVHAGTLAAHKKTAEGQTVLAMVPTLDRRKEWSRDFDRLVVDEAHHASAMTWQKIFQRWPDVVRVGLTATPFRLDGAPLQEIFDDLYRGPTITELINQHHLVTPQYRIRKLIDTHDVKLRKGGSDFDDADLSRAACIATDAIADDVAAHLDQRKAIVFAVDVAHSKSLRDAFEKRGFAVAHVDAKTSEKERNAILGTFRDHSSPQIICNCEIATEGFDAPACEAVILVRPTKSKALFLQMSGRGLRPFPPNKKNCLFFDYADMVRNHGTITDDIDFSLQDGLKPTTPPKEEEDDEDDDDDEREKREQQRERQLVDLVDGDMENMISVKVTITREDDLFRITVSRHGFEGSARFEQFGSVLLEDIDARINAGRFDPDSGTFRVALHNRREFYAGSSTSLEVWFHRLIHFFAPPTKSEMIRHYHSLVKMHQRRNYKPGWVYFALRRRWGEDILQREKLSYTKVLKRVLDYDVDQNSLFFVDDYSGGVVLDDYFDVRIIDAAVARNDDEDPFHYQNRLLAAPPPDRMMTPAAAE